MDKFLMLLLEVPQMDEEYKLYYFMKGCKYGSK
ncbi:unnamed protein product [Spirodela intermedia]|uniref:Uncharacterized protein n=1 Tax=Spirodela intermedia TaxID=51605 RepID=A0A7I8J837_SPIIN|nr:unnamed protein product [Spirodela intermedia]CAA6666347.1 unnamed protein product [Spirodela intermedia]